MQLPQIYYKLCGECGREFTSTSNNSFYCSYCRYNKQCYFCDAPILPTQKYCSQICRETAQDLKRSTSNNCKECGRYCIATYCSDECKSKSLHARSLKVASIDKPKECSICGSKDDLSINQTYTLMSGHVREVYVCKPCNRERCRSWRNKGDNMKKVYSYTRRWTKQNRDKSRAHYRVREAILNGTLLKKPCEVCNTDKAHAHHDDYSKPLEVRWLCPLHHRQHHVTHDQ